MRDTEAHSFLCIDKKNKKRFIITNSQPQARVSVCGMSVECILLYLLCPGTGTRCDTLAFSFLLQWRVVCVSVLAMPVNDLLENQFVTV